MLIQLAVILVGLAIGRFLGRAVERAIEPRVRAIHGKPRLLRFLALLLRRSGWIVAALLLTVAVVAIRAYSLPGHSALVAVAAALIAAWVAISVISRLIRNRSLARLVGWIAWIFVALRIVDALDEVSRALDALALRDRRAPHLALRS